MVIVLSCWSQITNRSVVNSLTKANVTGYPAIGSISAKKVVQGTINYQSI